jgi:hypothetical protein
MLSVVLYAVKPKIIIMLARTLEFSGKIKIPKVSVEADIKSLDIFEPKQ